MSRRHKEHPQIITERDLQCARYLCDGMSNQKIARAMLCGVRTVKHHIGRLAYHLGIVQNGPHIPRMRIVYILHWCLGWLHSWPVPPELSASIQCRLVGTAALQPTEFLRLVAPIPARKNGSRWPPQAHQVISITEFRRRKFIRTLSRELKQTERKRPIPISSR